MMPLSRQEGLAGNIDPVSLASQRSDSIFLGADHLPGKKFIFIFIFIFISNTRTGTTSIEDQPGPYGDGDGRPTGRPGLRASRHLPQGKAFEPEAEARVRPLWAADFATPGYA
jgi:hypothetical protein